MKVVVDVVNGEKMKELTAEIQRQEKEILAWNSAMKSAGPAQQVAFQANMLNAGKSIANAKTELKDLQSASSGAGMGLASLSYAIDDVQYGFSAIVNNIPQIVMGLGGSAGIAGAVGIAAVAANQLIKHWSELSAAFEKEWTGGSYDQLLKVRERAEAAAAAYEKLQKAKTSFEEGKGQQATKAIEDSGADKLRTQIAGALIAGGHVPMENDADFRNLAGVSIAGMRAKGATEAQIIESRRKKQMDDARKQAEQLLGRLSLGEPAARDMMKRLEKENPDVLKNFPKTKDKLTPDFFTDEEETEKGQARREVIRNAQQDADKTNAERAAVAAAEIKKSAEQDRALDHKKRIETLEDERTAVQRAQKDFDDKMWRRMHENQPAQILQGAKAATDYYQTGSRGDDPKQLAKEAHNQREKTNKLLEGIDDKMKKERRLVVPR